MNFEHELLNDSDRINADKFSAEIADDVAEGCVGAVNWVDFVTDATALPRMKDTARRVIKINLGYLPPDHVMMPLEPYLRALIQMHWQQDLTDDHFWQQTEDHMKLIRNADMKHNCCQSYDEAIYESYRIDYLPYGYPVKERLSRFLGYEPLLEHSLIAELWLRDKMADDGYQFSNSVTPEDIRAVTLIKYREVLLAEGQQAADTSPLWGCMGSD